MLIPRWRNLYMFKYSLSSTQLASFHSTPVNSEKWKNKWSYDVRGAQQPSKNYIRYATRQKRAGAKRALKDLLFNCGSLNTSFQGEDPLAKFGFHSENGDSRGSSNFSRHATKSQHKKKKRKSQMNSFYEDDIDPETIFHATFGKRWFTWSFDFFQSQTSQFQWRDRSNWSRNHRAREHDTASENESNDDSFTVGSSSDRIILDLPPTGPLKIEDVKKAFRASALKWHPDKHPRPSQAMAEEKFKLCLNAYKSLCNAFV